MSKLAVGIIESSDALTDLVFTTANTNSGNIRVFSSNDTILFSGTPVFTGSVPVASDAFIQANTARNQANAAFTQANAAFTQANTAITNAGNAFGKANTADINAVNAFGQANTASQIIPANTRMLFFQAAAPTGWTQVTTQNNKALRVVSGTGGGTGGTTDFTSVFTSRTPAGTVGSTTLTAAQSGVPAHSHGITDPGHVHAVSTGTTDGAVGRVDSSSSAQAALFNTNSNVTGITINNNVAADAAQGHDHTWTGTAMDFAVQYIDVIIASKD